ncbi:BTB/POZ domain-containing protein 9-like [Adelges cooleyi]|uniref:BTB/POZ domain-containing protein 9-like n=1 Tax=Adelges cooleyi TaxID=133065 RepID=UPI00218052CB|nr:BTB/POZ domain-containing protein 9-like [Adelges cooleyi]
MSVEELSEARGELQLVSSDINLDAIQFRHTWSPDKLQFRGHLKPNVNLIYESKNIPDTDDFDEGTNMLKLNNPSIINFIETIFWYEYRMDELKCFSYYIELSMNGHDWVRVLDHSNYNCRSFQRLWIHPRLVRYIHIVGTRSTANETFSFLDVKYNTEDMHKVEIKNGLVVPKFGYNVTSQYMGAFVIKGENNSNDGSLVKGYYESQARNDRYTYHELGSGFIVVQLALPYILSSMRLLLWGDDSYSYTIEASINNEEWEIIVDKSEELTQSWQVLQFKSRPILYIRITGVKSSAGNVFRIIYLEAPAQVALDSNIVEDNRAVTNYGRLTKRLKQCIIM